MKLVRNTLMVGLLLSSAFAQGSSLSELNLDGLRTRGTWSDAEGKHGTYKSVLTHKQVEGSSEKTAVTEATKVYDQDGKEIMDKSIELEFVDSGKGMFKIMKDGAEIGEGYIVRNGVHYGTTVNSDKNNGTFEQTIVFGRRGVTTIGSMNFSGEQAGKVKWNGHGRHHHH